MTTDLPAPTAPQLARSGVILLFHWHYYDGPLEGALEWDSNRYWFSALDDMTGHYGEVLELMDITVEDWARVDHSQALFEQHVGGYTRYDRDTQRCDLSLIKSCCADYEDPSDSWLPRGPVVATVRMWETP